MKFNFIKKAIQLKLNSIALPQWMIDGYNAIAPHISNSSIHVTNTDKTVWNTVTGKEPANANIQSHISNSSIHVTDLDKINWNSKASGVHSHTISDVTNLQSSLDAKLAASIYNTDKPTFALNTTWSVPSGGYLLNGTSQYLAALNANTFNLGNNPFSIVITFSGFTAPFVDASSVYAPLHKLYSNNGFNILLRGGGYNGFAFGMGTTSSVPSINAATDITATLSNGKLHQLIITRNGTVGALYLDGVLVPTTGSLTTSYVDQVTYPATIGKACASSTGYFPGKIHNIGFIDHVVNSTEIAQIWNNGLQGSPQKASGVTVWLADSGDSNIWKDLSGNNNDFVNNGGTSLSANVPTFIAKTNGWGTPHGGYNFTGTYANGDDRVVLPLTSPLNFSDQDFSLEFLFNNVGTSIYTFLMGCYCETTKLGYEISINNTTLKPNFTYGYSSATASYYSNLSILNNKTTHLVVIYNKTSGKIQFYINNVPDEVVKGSNTISSATTQPYTIGCYNSAGLGSNKDIYLVRAYNKALSSSEVSQLYNNGRADLAELPYTIGTTKGAWAFIGNCANVSMTSFTSATPTGFRASSDGSAIKLAGTNDEIPFKKGRTYVVDFDCLINSGSNVSLSYPENGIGGGNGSVADALIYQNISTGHHSYSFTATVTTPGVITFRTNSGVSSNFTISNISIRELGCVAQYKTSAGKYSWEDSSGNNQHGAVLGAVPICNEDRLVAWKDGVTGDTTMTNAVTAKYMATAVKITNITANTVIVKVGSTAGGTDIVNSQSIGANATVYVPVSKVFSETADQSIYVSSTSWNSANIKVTIIQMRLT